MSPDPTAPHSPVPQSVGPAIAFEAGLLVLAVALAWLVGIDLAAAVDWELDAFGLGLLATVPPVAALGLVHLVRWPAFERLRLLAEDLLGPLVRRSSFGGLVLLSLAAGVAEEALFRGVIQAGVAGWLGTAVGLLGASVLFGLVHWVTRLYALLAGIVGLYLGVLYLVTGNLLVPIVVHAVYDVVALWMLRGGAAHRGAGSREQ